MKLDTRTIETCSCTIQVSRSDVSKAIGYLTVAGETWPMTRRQVMLLREALERLETKMVD